MYERFTDRARKVTELAQQIARRHKYEYVGTEHLLLAIVEEGSGVAANVLRSLKVDSHQIEREIRSILPPGPHDDVKLPNLPLVPRLKKIMESAIDEARELRHDYIGTEHLLLGILLDPECVAHQVLLNLGLKPADVRRVVLDPLGYSMPGGPVKFTFPMPPRIGSLKAVAIPQSALAMVPETVARENCLIPLSFDDGVLRVAVADASDLDLFEKLTFILNYAIEPVIANRAEILAAIERHYGKG
jgi:MshEN domain/Clp amino terminal domain, pathogenicity island component